MDGLGEGRVGCNGKGGLLWGGGSMGLGLRGGGVVELGGNGWEMKE